MHNDPHCKLCKLSQTANTVCLLGDGPRRAEVMIVGEAPGKEEDERGEPFVGRTGKFLNRMLEEAGFDRNDIYICNAVSCRPPSNRTPTKGEIKACKKWLDYQIAMVKPKYVLLLGNVPLMSVTGSAGVTKRRGKPIEKDGIIYLPTFHPSYAMREPDWEEVLKKDIRFFSEIVDFGGVPEERGLNIKIVNTQERFNEMLRDLRGTVSFDIETNGLYPWHVVEKVKRRKNAPLTEAPVMLERKPAKITQIGFGTSSTQWILPVEHRQSPWDRKELEAMIEEIGERLEDCNIVTHNGKFDMLWMRVHFGVEWEIAYDTMLAHYMVDENSWHGLKELAMRFYGAPDWEIGKEEKKGAANIDVLAKYHAHDLYYTRALRFTLGKMMNKEPDTKRLFQKIMIPCANLFVDVEFHGVKVDLTKFDDAEAYLREELGKALKELKKWEPKYYETPRGTREPFNWGSPKQLAWLLFDELEIESPQKTKTGNPSASESALNQIDHPMVGALLRFRAAKQQLSFFIDGWKPYLVGDRLHPSFKLHGTVTGRLSCENPNLQQVPRDPRIRSLVIAEMGWSLFDADLSQIELRIAAELAGETTMLRAFNTGVDVHWLTALREIARGGGLKELVTSTAAALSKGTKLSYSQSIDLLLKMGPDAAQGIVAEWKEYRKKAKAINFGYLYGMWWKKFKLYARDNYGVEVTDEEAQASRVAFFDLYPEFVTWHDRTRRYVRKHGYVRSLAGRRRRLPEARSAQDSPQRREAERQAINSPVQSFANEINLMALLQLRKEFPRRVLRIVGTVHDAILFEVRNDYVERVYQRILEIMQRPELFDDFEIELEVPIEAECKIGPWAAGVSLDKWKEKQLAA